MKNLFSIGEVSKQQNISRQALIFYDKIGLFCPAYTDPDNGYRYYSERQLITAGRIAALRALGFGLSETRELLRLSDRAGEIAQQIYEEQKEDAPCGC